MKKVIFTIGIPGSGKTYWANKIAAQSITDVVILERDEIREQLHPGYTQGKPNKKVEQEVTEYQRRAVRQALNTEGIETIIISDTNLNRERLRDFKDFVQGCRQDVVSEEKVLWDSLDFKLCAKRNRARIRTVPDNVLMSFWRRFMSQYADVNHNAITYSGQDLVFVGDIHAQYTNLRQLVDAYLDDKYHLIFLGDINDSRRKLNYDESDPEISFLKCFELISQLVEYDKATLLHSNHQKNLINALRGKRKKASWGLKGTLDELRDAGLLGIQYKVDYTKMDGRESEEILSIVPTNESREIADWFDARPYYFLNTVDCNGPVIGVHAQFAPKLGDTIYNMSGRGIEAAVYGTRTIPGPDMDGRVRWWENYKDQKIFMVAGHYHTFFINDYCAVIDTGCGQGGPLCAFNYTANEIRLFGVH